VGYIGADCHSHLYRPYGIHDFFQIVLMLNNLKALRGAHGLSQADLAEKLNVSRQTINAIETGRYDPSLPLAFAIAKLFQLKIEEIFTP
jgi:putative transcriptional regulator